MNPFSVVQAARECPERVAIVAEGRAFTFSEVAAEAARAANWLAAQNLQPQALVAFAPLPTLDSLLMLYALLELEHPVALLHSRWSAQERQTLLTSWQPALEIPRGWSLRQQAPGAQARLTENLPQAPLAIVPTSGSSALPKGVALSHAAFAASARAHALNVGWEDADRWLLSLPLAHVGGLSVVTRCLLARRALVLPDTDSGSGLMQLRQALASGNITLLSLVPTLLSQLLAVADWELPPSVRAILLGGAPAGTALLEACVRRGWPVLPTYGLSEACSQVTTREYARRFSADSDVGKSVDGMQLRVIDGEIFIRGPQLFDAYYPSGERPLTADGWFATGDLGELDADGRLHVQGRKGDLLITGGENVHPLEVERCLLNHPEIDQACVFGVADALWGQRVVAAVVAKSNTQLTSEAVIAFASQHLARFRRPRQIVFVDSLPLTAAGKVDRRALAHAFETLAAAAASKPRS